MDLLTHAVTGAAIGSAMAPDAHSRPTFMVAGAVAGLLPDLDGLARYIRPSVAWRYHRVALHGVAAAPLLAAVVTGGVVAVCALARSAAVPVWPLALVATAAVVSHLALDVLTSFGTALLYPFSRRRFSTHSHFIVDLGMLIGLSYGVVSGKPAFSLAATGVCISAVIAWRCLLLRGARRAFAARVAGVVHVSVEAGPMSPMQWTALASTTDGRTLIARTVWPGVLLGQIATVTNAATTTTMHRAARVSLVAAYADTIDFLHTEWIGDGDDRELLIEDLKWRVHPGFRPLCVSVPWRDGQASGPARERAMLWRGPQPRRRQSMRVA